MPVVCLRVPGSTFSPPLRSQLFPGSAAPRSIPAEYRAVYVQAGFGERSDSLLAPGAIRLREHAFVFAPRARFDDGSRRNLPLGPSTQDVPHDGPRKRSALMTRLALRAYSLLLSFERALARGKFA